MRKTIHQTLIDLNEQGQTEKARKLANDYLEKVNIEIELTKNQTLNCTFTIHYQNNLLNELSESKKTLTNQINILNLKN